MGQELLPRVEIEPEGEARAAVVWLHGLGADGHDFEPIVPYLGLDPLGVRFVFPHAPRRGVSINMGLIMPAWYDVQDVTLSGDHDLRGLEESVRQVRALVERENERGIASTRIALAGFSQGGAVALHVGLSHTDPLAGILVLSSYLPAEQTLTAKRSEANRRTPIFQAHGLLDPMVPLGHGEAARDKLLEWGYDVAWKTYPMGHEVCPEEIADVGAWLGERLLAVPA